MTRSLPITTQRENSLDQEQQSEGHRPDSGQQSRSLHLSISSLRPVRSNRSPNPRLTIVNPESLSGLPEEALTDNRRTAEILEIAETPRLGLWIQQVIATIDSSHLPRITSPVSLGLLLPHPIVQEHTRSPAPETFSGPDPTSTPYESTAMYFCP
jgi:hypothetical protein